MTTPISASAESLRETLRRDFQLKTISLEVAKHTLQITMPQSVEPLLDDLSSRAPDDVAVQDERLPYWADVWPSAQALAEFVCANDLSDLTNLLRNGAHGVEIGCGLGVAGIAAGLLGTRVTFTDYLPDALSFAALNWIANLHK